MGKPRSTTAEFIKRASLFHNNKYDYSKVVYVNQLTLVIIICPDHGEWLHMPRRHLKWGCNKCAQEIRMKSIRVSQQNVIGRAIQMHSKRYDYSKVNFVRTHDKVEIICRKHGSFFQSMHCHIMGAGCAQCIRKVSLNEAKWLDELGIPKEFRYFKISVANNKYYYADGFDPITNTVYEYNGDYYHGNPIRFNPDDVNKTVDRTFGELYQRTLIKENNLKAAGYNVVTMWEYDFNK